jgi:hypothetical protein
VVTPARFASGLTYKDFLAQAKVNVDKFDENYGTAHVSAEDAAFFKKVAATPGGPAKVLALGEDWCPDVYRGLPVIAKIAEASGMELRAFPRDKNLDVMNEFLNQGQFLSIPVAVFYTKDLRYVAHWTERPAFANAERARITDQAKKDLPSANEQDFRAEVRKRTTVRYPVWQQETVKEIRQLLARAPGIA